MEYDTDVSTDLLKFIFESRGVSEAVIQPLPITRGGR